MKLCWSELIISLGLVENALQSHYWLNQIAVAVRRGFTYNPPFA